MLQDLLKYLDWIEYADQLELIHLQTCYLNFICLLITTYVMAHFYVKSVQPVQMQILYKTPKKIAYFFSFIMRCLSAIPWLLHMYHFLKYPSFPMSDIETWMKVPATFSDIYESDTNIRLYAAWSVLIVAFVIFNQAIYDSGKETMYPQEDGKLFGGIYNYIRHPQYLSEGFLLYVGIALLYDSPFLLILTMLLYLPMGVFLAKQEEKDLVLRFGDTYREYITRTGFYFPKIVPDAPFKGADDPDEEWFF